MVKQNNITNCLNNVDLKNTGIQKTTIHCTETRENLMISLN